MEVFWLHSIPTININYYNKFNSFREPFDDKEDSSRYDVTMR